MTTTPCKTPLQKAKLFKNGKSFGTPMFIPPTPMLKSLGYGTGVQVYRIERSPVAGRLRSPWAMKRLTRRCQSSNENAISFNKRIEKEANILRKLDHPNIIGFRGMPSTEDGRHTLIMEVCDISLGDLLELRLEADAGPLEANKIKRVCADMIKALDYLHTKAKLLHGDIKSYNVLIKDDFSVCKLCDFGVSLSLNDEGFVDQARHPDARFIGTDLWCAPESLIANNLANISSKSDMFSFGLVLYECIALVPPHTWVLNRDTNHHTPNKDATDKMTINDSVVEINDDSIIEINDSIVEISEEEEFSEEEDDDEDEEDPLSLLCGTRPPMPETHQLSNDYSVLIEMFFVCTNQEPEDRPTATSLLDVFD